ncbi:MolR family transcriptional regulator, partial [Streptomyces nanshensis]
GPARRNAEQALRAVAATHGQDAVLEAAGCHGPEAVAAVRDLLSADSMELALPPKMPEPAAWADPRLLPRVLLRDRTSPLPDESVGHLLTMLAISRPGAVYTGVEVVKEACDPESLADFVWSVFEQWRMAGMPPKESWALHALGWLGDDDTVRRLTPVLRNWPGEGAHKRAVEGLDVLAALGSDVALMHLHGVAQRVKFKALRARAEEKLRQLAADRGLSGEELADRLVPDFGLDADGSTVVDYGPRHFTVGFDEQLRPYVLDQHGKRRKSLPQPGAHDDAELAAAERKRFMALKKDVRTVASDQVRRLEAAMVAGRSWTAGEFRDLFASHPLLWHLVRRLVWLSVPAGTPESALYG